MEKIGYSNIIQPTQIASYSAITRPVSFRAEGVQALERTPETDTVEISKPKKKKNSVLRLGAFLGAGLATLITAGVLISKHQTNKISKLYKENLVLSNLAEKLEFKEAKTVEEGINFAKEILKIPEVDNNFTLEAINIANKGLVDVSNAHKGKLFMPRALHFMELGDDTVAGVARDVNSRYFGHMTFNSQLFDNTFMNKKLDKCFKIREFGGKGVNNVGENLVQNTEKDLSKQDLLVINWSNEFRALAERYKESADNLTIPEKMNLYGMLCETQNAYSGIFDRNPLYFIKNNLKLFQEQGIHPNIEELSKLTTKEQSDKLVEILLQSYKKNGKPLGMKSHSYTPEATVYHEMGHLQDYAENLKKLDLANWKKINIKEIWKDVRSGKKDRAHVDELENHWGTLAKDRFKKLFDKEPEKFKKLYPDFYEFVTNQEYQQTAGKISAYAQSGIGEFIAETYAELIKGRKLSDDIMELYKKYGGPIPG